ncbi:MAG TPA: 1-acyl-sn-glycerol-3-phosphate acyltransferase [Acidimicrobiia bacterium]|nr:1-acyl-sn-glycerol-3-phosphate acyltransferase [Acidimicrobiia bacterium]
MRPPPRPVRRLLLAPALVLGVVAAAVTLPVIVIAAAFISRYVPGKWRILRITWFLFLYLLVEAAALTMMFSLWVLSGFGLKIHAPAFIEAHYVLMAWMMRRIVASAKFTFKLNIVRESSPRRSSSVPPRNQRPVMVLSRHAGPGDSILLMDALANSFKRQPRIVLKEFLQWDPMIDVMLNRLPSAFVAGGKDGRGELLETITEMAATMDGNDAFVIFPEGANYTEKRARRSIEKLREMGRPDLAERAEELENTLPPRSTGVMTALAAAPPGTDVFFVGHAGLETFVTPGDIWRGIPTDTNVAARVWYVSSDEIPSPENQETWLFDMWVEIDDWISERLIDTEEPFDDPDHY